MDQLKSQLAVVKRHSFWIMCGGILLVCLGSWYMSTRSIYQEQQKQLADIKQVFEGLISIRTANPKHPNQQTEQGMDALNVEYSKEVYKSWQKQYDRQSSVLVWPASFQNEFIERVDKLRPIETVPPPPTPIGLELPELDRLIYRNFIDVELPILATTIGTEWVAKSRGAAGSEGGFDSGGLGGGGLGAGEFTPGPGSRGGRGRMGPMMPGGSGAGYGQDAAGAQMTEDKSIVAWAAANQQELLQTHFGFVDLERTPSTLEVLYAQEDLWVLQNIMDVIKAANDNATARHEAAIKEIDFVRIGRSAMGMAGALSGGMSGEGGMMPGGMPGKGEFGPGMASSGMGSAGMAGPGAMQVASPGVGETGSPDGGAAAMMGKNAGMAGMMGGGGAMSMDPAFGRYVDGTYQPLDPVKLRGALTSKSKEDALLAVAKRMPVRMRFRVDQRKMNKVLAECGNSKLPVEVRQVRINRSAADGGGGGGGGYDSGGPGGGMPGGGAMRGGYGETGSSDSGFGGGSGRMANMLGGAGMGGPGSVMPGGGAFGGGLGGAGGAGGASRAVGGESFTAEVDPHLIDVELYGIVYIYNPVNRSQLGLDPTPATVAVPAATPPATPASSPSPPATTAPASGPAAILPGAGPN